MKKMNENLERRANGKEEEKEKQSKNIEWNKRKKWKQKKVKNQVVCSSAKKCLLLVCILEKFYFSNY